MGCFYPIPASVGRLGGVILHREQPDSRWMRLRCGRCIGCRQDNALAWALRCQLELADHRSASFLTLTYDEEHVPVTLEKRHLQLLFKRLRRISGRRFRYFASGEYGEKFGRPHYHALLYGADPDRDLELVTSAWGMGDVDAGSVTFPSIAYVAGYCSKKLSDSWMKAEERVDVETGEVYRWQPPFRVMSRRPGIGSSARAYARSWRDVAIVGGRRVGVPRYLHEAWVAQASAADREVLADERAKLRPLTREQLDAREVNAVGRQAQQGAGRAL